MKKKGMRVLFTVLCILTLSACLAVPCSPILGNSKSTAAASVSAAGKNGLKKEKGYYYYYENGKKLKNSWQTIKGKKYYFKKNGAAATLSCKIKGKYYVFNQKGQLMQPKSTKIVKIGKKKYRVSPKGLAVKGWTKNRKNYFFKTGEMAAGIVVNEGKLYCFSSAGTYNKAKTKKLQKAAQYEKKLAPVQKILGKPKKVKYYGASCYGDGTGKDGVLIYKNFKVSFFKPRYGEMLYMGVE